MTTFLNSTGQCLVISIGVFRFDADHHHSRVNVRPTYLTLSGNQERRAVASARS